MIDEATTDPCRAVRDASLVVFCTPVDRVVEVVTLCGEAAEVCPTVAASVRRVHWPLPDPSAAPEQGRLEQFRLARDEIRWRVSSLWPSED